MTMKISVLIEPMNGKGFRASGIEPFCITAEGETREEALEKLKTEAESRLKAGAEIVTVDIGPSELHPLLKFSGIFKDDPLFDEWQQAIEEYRRQLDEDEGRP
jgi:predicted RNase H-like HicB family nuclease